MEVEKRTRKELKYLPQSVLVTGRCEFALHVRKERLTLTHSCILSHNHSHM